MQEYTYNPRMMSFKKRSEKLLAKPALSLSKGRKAHKGLQMDVSGPALCGFAALRELQTTTFSDSF
jgi:hypothetical protein